MKNILITILFISLLYLGTSFVYFDFNPKHWGYGCRVMFVFTTFAFLTIDYFNYSNRSTKH